MKREHLRRPCPGADAADPLEGEPQEAVREARQEYLQEGGVMGLCKAVHHAYQFRVTLAGYLAHMCFELNLLMQSRWHLLEEGLLIHADEELGPG